MTAHSAGAMKTLILRWSKMSPKIKSTCLHVQKYYLGFFVVVVCLFFSVTTNQKDR